jgi:hypothetical protein
MDLVAALIGLVWNVLLLIVLWRVSNRSVVFFVLGFYLLSLYTADRILPRVLVDFWTNFDAVRSPALRPILIFPDFVLIAVLIRYLRSVSSTAMWLALALAASTLIGLGVGLANPAIPASAALFWATVPLRGIGIVLLLDVGITKMGWTGTGRDVTRVLAAGGGFLAVQILAVVVVKFLAERAGVDLATVWSGFDWVRPNLPGWNNNIAASLIGLGAATVLLLPDLHRLPSRVGLLLVVLSAIALLFAEYRTAIIVTIISCGVRVAFWTYSRVNRRHSQPAAFVSACGAMGLSVAVLLLAAAAIVPRLGGLNPLTYVASVVGQPTTQVGPSATPLESESQGSDEIDASTTSRAQITHATLTVWLRQPILGPGLGAWEFTRPTVPTFLQKAITPHNGFAWVLADLGLVGLAAFYLLPAILIITARPPLTILLWLGLAALLEIAIVGVAHSRYGVAYWSVVAFAAIGLRERARSNAT